MEFLNDLAYHALIALSTCAIVIGAIPWLKLIAVHLPGQGLQEAIAQ